MKYLDKIKNIITDVRNIKSEISSISGFLNNDLKNPKVTTGKLLSNLNNQQDYFKNIQDAEFQVFSQWGDDGIIQYLINKIEIANHTFVEFGVENYKESNTRFLLINNNWSGMVIDGSEQNINYIKGDIVSWAHDLHAVHSFITRENINALLGNLPFGQDLGILSIDIDGNDYYIWEELNVVNPEIIISEYNSLFGYANAWTIPYNPNFVRPSSNKTSLHSFYGTSLLSLCDLAEEKGYYFIGCNSSGNNAYFIRKDKIGPFRPLTAQEGFVDSKFRECFNKEGERVTSKQLLPSLKGLEVFNTRTKKLEAFG